MRCLAGVCFLALMSVLRGEAIGSAVSQDAKPSTPRLNYSTCYKPPGNMLGYNTGRTVTSHEVGNATLWYVLDAGQEYRITAEHGENGYDTKEFHLQPPGFFLAENRQWYKIDDPPDEFREYAFNNLRSHVGSCNIQLTDEDYGPHRANWEKTEDATPYDRDTIRRVEDHDY